MSEKLENSPETPRDYLRLFLSGMAMGAADIVPGVSGGTMAFILNIYEDLINAIKSFNLDVVKLALQFKVKDTMDAVHWKFLLPLGAGIGASIILLSSLLSYLLENETVYLFSFFFGLVIASIVAVGAKIENWTALTGGALIGGAVVAGIIVSLVPAEASHDPLSLFLSGAIAIVAMILPGISGSFILLILGQYEYVLESVHERRIFDLMMVALGCAVGIIIFSRILSYLLKNYREPVISVLVGFMIGSLLKIWPWKEVLESKLIDGEDVILREKIIAPSGEAGEILLAVALMFLGFLVVSTIEHQQSKSNPVFLGVQRLLGKPPANTREPVAETGQD